MKILFSLFCLLATAAAYAQECFTIIVNPGEDASTQARLNWHSDAEGQNECRIALAGDTAWTSFAGRQEFVAVFDSLRSKDAAGNDIVECPSPYRYTLQIDSLTPGTAYQYSIGNATGQFKTAPTPTEEWTAALISDFHVYSPLPGRQQVAMAMLDTLKSVAGGDFDLLLHAGDICAWGGSYSFWRNLYAEPNFNTHLVAGCMGNHDFISRAYARNTTEFFRVANNNPLNGYHPQMGVCYFFKYANTLFVMLNSEAMRAPQALEDAQLWLRQVVANNPADRVVVIEHFQWFYGQDGRDSQYPRWRELFDELGIDLAIGANNHIYLRTDPIKDGQPNPDGTVYLQLPSSDNERGEEMAELAHNAPLIATRWTEGPATVGAILLKSSPKSLTLTLYDRNATPIDTITLP